MPLYKFYRIVPKDTTQTDCYIGHTVQPLRKRFTEHGRPSNSTSSKALFERYGKKGLQIVLIHELELPDKEYARREERRLLEEVREQAVNKLRPWTSEEETKELMATTAKQWREANKEYVATHRKRYIEAHQEQRRQYSKQYHEAHREIILARQKQYREAKKATPLPDASLDTQQTQP